ncbi:hypothetical protein FQZ97_588660 [compost metagenome]
MPLTIYYDGDCPFCQRYTDLLKLQHSAGPVELVSVRESPALAGELKAAGFDLDSGMVIDHDGQRLGGAAAMARLSQLMAPGGWFKRLNAVAFGSPYLGSLVYPLLRAGRSASLLALGRPRVHAGPDPRLAVFTLFAHAWGLCAVLQLAYASFFAEVIEFRLSVWSVGLLGAAVLMRPHSARLFVALTAVMLIDAWVQMPAYSNSTALKNYALVALSGAGLYALLRGRDWGSFVSSFAPVARGLLLIMYFFGVFHKLNTDFLNPEVSCAVALWDRMPEPIRQFNPEWFLQLAMYGTLVIESLIMLGLLARRTRHVSIVAGIAFHSMLGLSGYGFYPTFSTLVISLHLLFLAPQAAARIMDSPLCTAIRLRSQSWLGLFIASAWLFLIALMLMTGNSSNLALAWLPWPLAILYLVARYGAERPMERIVGRSIVSRTAGLNLVTVLFFLNCFAPYLGLKTAQSMNMFANLQLEGGHSNHLVLPGAPGPFGYMGDIVHPFNVKGSNHLKYIEDHGLFVTYYDLLNHLERTPGSAVSFIRGGVEHRNQTAETLAGEIQATLHPRWVRNWLLFMPIDMGRPKRCWPNQ